MSIELYTSLVVGLILPFIFQFLKDKFTWFCNAQGWQTQLIVYGVSIVVTFGSLAIQGKLNLTDFVGTITLAISLSEVLYRQLISKYWQ